MDEMENWFQWVDRAMTKGAFVNYGTSGLELIRVSINT